MARIVNYRENLHTRSHVHLTKTSETKIHTSVLIDRIFFFIFVNLRKIVYTLRFTYCTVVYSVINRIEKPFLLSDRHQSFAGL